MSLISDFVFLTVNFRYFESVQCSPGATSYLWNFVIKVANATDNDWSDYNITLETESVTFTFSLQLKRKSLRCFDGGCACQLVSWILTSRYPHRVTSIREYGDGRGAGVVV